MKTDADIGEMLPQAKECQEPPKEGEVKKASLLELLREVSPAHILISESQPLELCENVFLLF